MANFQATVNSVISRFVDRGFSIINSGNHGKHATFLVVKKGVTSPVKVFENETGSWTVLAESDPEGYTVAVATGEHPTFVKNLTIAEKHGHTQAWNRPTGSVPKAGYGGKYTHPSFQPL